MDDKKNQPKEAKSIKIDKHAEEIEKLKQEVEDTKQKFLRALADYQNLERRVRDEKEMIRENSRAETILAFLPFLDNIEKAEVFIKDQGLQMIKNHFLQSLVDLGVEEIDVLNKEFDPHVAEAVDVVEGEKDNIVVEVLRKGYRFGDKVLRPANVKVSKKTHTN